MVAGAPQSFQFSGQIIWFLRNNRALFRFRYQIFHNFISITKLQKNHTVKANFKLTARATLTSKSKNNLFGFFDWFSIGQV